MFVSSTKISRRHQRSVAGATPTMVRLRHSPTQILAGWLPSSNLKSHGDDCLVHQASSSPSSATSTSARNALSAVHPLQQARTQADHDHPAGGLSSAVAGAILRPSLMPSSPICHGPFPAKICMPPGRCCDRWRSAARRASGAVRYVDLDP